ncbi:MAG: septum site-determining protein MinC, partial [Solirubrobacteraceae bacterium]
MSDRLQPQAVVDIRYGQVGLVQVRVNTTEPGAILDDLTGRVATAPHFFRRTGVCLDLSSLERVPEVAQVQGVIDALRRAGMLAVGVSGDPDALAVVSAALALPVLTSFRSPARQVPVVQPAVLSTGLSAAPIAEAAVPSRLSAAAAAASVLGVESGASESALPALIHGRTVRSGQRLYGRNRDLIVTASVGAGAEVVADGCVHIYGALRGRALAGAHGQLGARVFCHEFYAELV